MTTEQEMFLVVLTSQEDLYIHLLTQEEWDGLPEGCLSEALSDLRWDCEHPDKKDRFFLDIKELMAYCRKHNINIKVEAHGQAG